MSATPVTFVEPSYVLFDKDLNAVLTTEHGNLAIFSTKGMADLWAARSRKNLAVRAVHITPVDGEIRGSDAKSKEGQT